MAPHIRRGAEGGAASHRDVSPESGWSALLERHVHLAPGLLAPKTTTHGGAGDQHGEEKEDHGASRPTKQRPPVDPRRAVGPRLHIDAVRSDWPVHGAPHHQIVANRMPRAEGQKGQKLVTLRGASGRCQAIVVPRRPRVGTPRLSLRHCPEARSGRPTRPQIVPSSASFSSEICRIVQGESISGLRAPRQRPKVHAPESQSGAIRRHAVVALRALS